jgi:Glycosyl hydrolase family 12.
MPIKFFNDQIIPVGEYYISNNLWGSKSEIGYQCIKAKSGNDADKNWVTFWNWKKSTDSIKSYSSIVLGWHWGWKYTTTGLPIQLTKCNAINSIWDYELKQKREGRINVCFDMWLSNKEVHNNEDPTEEIMIWLNRAGSINPIGSFIGNVKVNNDAYDLWIGLHPSGKWKVYSFIRNENVSYFNEDINAFIKCLKNEHKLESSYLMSIESGIEVFEGKGRLITKKYNIEII